MNPNAAEFAPRTETMEEDVTTVAPTLAPLAAVQPSTSSGVTRASIAPTMKRQREDDQGDESAKKAKEEPQKEQEEEIVVLDSSSEEDEEEMNDEEEGEEEEGIVFYLTFA